MISELKEFFRRVANTVFLVLCDSRFILVVGSLLLIFEAVLSVFIVLQIKYTEIDWIAYMQESEGYLNGTYDYKKISGQTGYLPYPAVFLYIYSVLYWLSNAGNNIKMAQYIFVIFYLVNLAIVFEIYRKTRVVPPYILLFMCLLSYRIHSIFMLRLFNDPLAMLFVYAAIWMFLVDRWTLGCCLYSLAVAVKMNVLLFAPGLLLVLLLRHGVWDVLGHLAECFILQLLVGLPFLVRFPSTYLERAFEFSRQFDFKWTVNWRFLPLNVFHSRVFHSNLLLCQVICLVIFFNAFLRSRGGWSCLLNFSIKRHLNANEIIYPMFLSNFLGVVFSRSLHYQFYSWYFHTLHYLLWCAPLSSGFRLLLLGLIELSWNIYPSTFLSSGCLHCCHAVVLVSLMWKAFANESLYPLPPLCQKYKLRGPIFTWFSSELISDETESRSLKTTKRSCQAD